MHKQRIALAYVFVCVAAFLPAYSRHWEPYHDRDGGYWEDDPGDTTSSTDWAHSNKTAGLSAGNKLKTVAENLYVGKRYKDVDCDDFVIEAMKEDGFKLTETMENEVRMTSIGTMLRSDDDSQVQKAIALIKDGDPSARGIVGVMQDAGWASEVGNAQKNTKELQDGDIVQYWAVYGDKASGHTVIVDHVNPNNGDVSFIGSHKSLDGVGVLTLTKKTIESYQQFWACRPTK